MIDDDSTDRPPRSPAPREPGSWARPGVLPEAGPGSGKGNVLWKSLHACEGDLLCWLDADLRNFRADTVARLLEPLVTDVDTVLVKASYTRSFEGAPTGGGRVTELVARPLLSLLFPKLADIVQPLGGEYAARRDAVEVLPFVEGWGVELGLLVDVVERFGRDAVAQVDLGTREHRNRPVDELAAQSLAIIATALRRRGLDAVRRPDPRAPARRPRRQRRSRARRDPRAPPDRDDPRRTDRQPSNRAAAYERLTPVRFEGGPAGFHGGFFDEERGAVVGLAGLPHSVGEREHLRRRSRSSSAARASSVTWPGDHGDAGHRRDRRPTRARRRRPCRRDSTGRACLRRSRRASRLRTRLRARRLPRPRRSRARAARRSPRAHRRARRPRRRSSIAVTSTPVRFRY